jgi:ParB family chromosome partitioning protein
LLDRVDAGEIAIRPAVTLSYLSEAEQITLEARLSITPCKIDTVKADSLKLISENKKFTDDKIEKILSGEINSLFKPKTPPALKIKHKIYSKFFSTDVKLKEMEAVIEQALTEYFANHKNQEGEESA